MNKSPQSIITTPKGSAPWGVNEPYVKNNARMVKKRRNGLRKKHQRKNDKIRVSIFEIGMRVAMKKIIAVGLYKYKK